MAARPARPAAVKSATRRRRLREWGIAGRRDGASEAQLGLYREAAAADFLAGRRLQDECPPTYTWRSVLLGWFRCRDRHTWFRCRDFHPWFRCRDSESRAKRAAGPVQELLGPSMAVIIALKATRRRWGGGRVGEASGGQALVDEA